MDTVLSKIYENGRGKRLLMYIVIDLLNEGPSLEVSQLLHLPPLGRSNGEEAA